MDELCLIHDDMLRLERENRGRLVEVHPAFRASARNLVHYLALRRRDLRPLQEQLTRLGLSSLGRTESHVLAAVRAVLGVLDRLSGQESRLPDCELIDFVEGRELLRRHTADLLGVPPPGRAVRIMVTMPSEAAHEYPLVRDLVARGMDVMRVNCAHDGPQAWKGMVANLRRAEQEVGRRCCIEMDVAGPKLRTGPIDPRSQISKWRPQRDASGRVTEASRIWLTPADRPEPPPSPADGSLRVRPELLAGMHGGDRLGFSDLRGKSRVLEVAKQAGAGRWATSTQTTYLAACSTLDLTHLRASGSSERLAAAASVAAPPPSDHFVLLAPGDTLILTRSQTPGRPALRDGGGRVLSPATIPCTLPEVFADVEARERIAFDDGKIGGVIEEVGEDALRIRITAANPTGDKLRADKGINLPDSDLHLPALSEKDVEDLSFAVEHADIIGLSFVKRPEDVRLLQDQLARLGRNPAVLLKIETRSGFECLPSLLLAAMRGARVGVMIARGDLAVEVGWERLAEAQEEILWICEAAHVPVVWATQVLESLAKKGVPSRAEITDAAMGERAECVMLNKGPHLLEAVRVLDDILQRMEAHQSKKSARLRLLRLSTLEAG
jgi:pyruvate kinase